MVSWLQAMLFSSGVSFALVLDECCTLFYLSLALSLFLWFLLFFLLLMTFYGAAGLDADVYVLCLANLLLLFTQAYGNLKFSSFFPVPHPLPNDACMGAAGIE
uniref:Uncharacterized protein n=1 Tax=Rhipicephalus microplus TaxID=6941 RepID=A0A6M2DCB4_RHIMP